MRTRLRILGAVVVTSVAAAAVPILTSSDADADPFTIGNAVAGATAGVTTDAIGGLARGMPSTRWAGLRPRRRVTARRGRGLGPDRSGHRRRPGGGRGAGQRSASNPATPESAHPRLRTDPRTAPTGAAVSQQPGKPRVGSVEVAY
jgi:hypothetical protein